MFEQRRPRQIRSYLRLLRKNPSLLLSSCSIFVHSPSFTFVSICYALSPGEESGESQTTEERNLLARSQQHTHAQYYCFFIAAAAAAADVFFGFERNCMHACMHTATEKKSVSKNRKREPKLVAQNIQGSCTDWRQGML